MTTAAYHRRSRPRRRRRELATKATLALGGLALAYAIFAAHSSPASGYEASIYTATPTAFWVGVAGGALCALAAGLTTRSRSVRAAAFALAGTAFVALAALPLLRGYAYYGTADALSHLGWTRDFLAGRMAPTELLYPAIHLFAGLVHVTAGVALERAVMLVVFTYVALFLVFVPLCVRAITDDTRAAFVGALAAAMLLPINDVSAHMTAHPSTMAIMFVPVVLALLVLYMRRAPEEGWRSPTALGALLAVVSGSLVLLHPQQAANLLVVVGTVAGVQFLRRWRWGTDAGLHRLYAQAAFLGVAFLAWGLRFERTRAAVGGLVNYLLFEDFATNTITARGASLTAIGASLEELFVKLFLVSAVFAVLTLAYVAASLLGLVEETPGTKLVRYLGVGLVPAGMLFALYVVANIQTVYFRHLGFLMVFATVVGSIALARGAGALAARPGWVASRGSTATVAVAVGLLAVLAAAALFPSPFVYRPNLQVSDAALTGYDDAFAHGTEDVEWMGVRQGPDRFRDGLTGTGELDSSYHRDSHGVAGETLEGGLTDRFGDPTYLAIARWDRVREGAAFRNLRYSESELSGVDAYPGVNRVRSNGAFELYYVAESP